MYGAWFLESVIDSLQGASLLESAGSYSVDMHDIIRDMALWIVRGPGGEKWSVLNRAWVQDATIRKMNNGYWTREEWPPKDRDACDGKQSLLP